MKDVGIYFEQLLLRCAPKAVCGFVGLGRAQGRLVIWGLGVLLWLVGCGILFGWGELDVFGFVFFSQVRRKPF